MSHAKTPSPQKTFHCVFASLRDKNVISSRGKYTSCCAKATAGDSFKAPLFTVSWPTGELGGMGLEGAVKLGYRKEIAALDDPKARKALFDKMVAEMYQQGKALNVASAFEFDDAIDPMDSRRWILSALRSVPEPVPSPGKKRPCIDTW